MRKSHIIVITLLQFLAIGLSAAPVTIDYYYQPGCTDCRKIEALIIPRLAAEFPSSNYILNRYDTGNPKNFLCLLAVLDRMKIHRNDNVAMVINHNRYLGGYHQIETELPRQLQMALDNAIEASPVLDNPPAAPTALLQRQAAAITLGLVVLAGLEDGINPCVFSTLVFMLSILAVAGVAGRALLRIGGAYCLGVFLCYLALGFGLFRTFRALSIFPILQCALEILIVATLIIMAGISFADAWNFYCNPTPKALRLRLPESLKRHINLILHRSLTGTYPLPRAFAAGLLVTLLEAVCSGQVYLPTLVMLAREAGPGWWLYLLLYNLMFIVPLVLLLYCYFRGTAIKRLLEWSRNNVVPGKITLGLFFLLLAAIILGLAK